MPRTCSDGTLTGALAMLDDAVRRVVDLGVPPERAIAAASARSAAVLGLAEAPGTVALDGDLVVRAAWRGGRRIDGGAGGP